MKFGGKVGIMNPLQAVQCIALSTILGSLVEILLLLPVLCKFTQDRYVHKTLPTLIVMVQAFKLSYDCFRFRFLSVNKTGVV